MAKVSLLAGTTSYTVNLFIMDSTSTTGAGKTGLAFNTASLTAYYVLPKAAAVAITLATQTVTGAWSSGGFVEVDATNLPGVYRFDVPNACLATTNKSCAIQLKGATAMAQIVLEVELTATDNQTALLTAAQIATGVWQDAAAGDFTTASSIGKSLYTSGVVPGGTNGLFIAGTNAATTITTALTTTFTGNLTGSVASVTGAVGSVTAGVTVTTNNDKTGYGLSAAAVQAIWDALTSALTTVGSIGKWIVDKLDVVVSTRGTSTYAGGDTAGTTTLLTRVPGTVQPQTGDSYARLGAPVGVSTSADIAALPTANATADALLDRAAGVETGLTVRQAMRLVAAACTGLASGLATTTGIYKSADISGTTVQGTKSRITATIDASGNRTAITVDLT